jgi:hypothetical protein
MANYHDGKQPVNEFEKFREFTRKVVSVPKTEIDKREAEYQKMRKEKRKQRAS